MTYLENNPVKVLLLACLVIFFAHLDVIFINIMEARNFVAAREMVVDGNWLFTTMNGLPRYEKPPLPTWLTAVSAMLFGMKSVFALRLPAALAAAFMVWMFFRFSNLIKTDKQFGLISSFILATSFFIIFSGRNGQWDIFTHSFMLAGIYFLFKFLEYRHNVWQNALLAAVFTGCSFLSKGPVSLYALFLPFLIAYAIVYRFKSFRAKWISFLVFLLLTTVLSLSWYVYVRLADPESFIAIAEEEVTNWSNYNIRPFYYYWSFFTQSGIWTIPAFIGLLYPYLKSKVSYKNAYRFSFLWTVFSVILLSVIPEKKSRYLLPVLIPLALNTGFYIDYLIHNFKFLKDKKETFPVYFNFGLIAFLGVSFPIAGYLFFGEKLEGLWSWFILISLALVVIGVLMFIQLKRKNIQQVFLLSVLFIMSVMVFGFPISKAFNTNPEFRNIDTLSEYVERNDVKLYVFSQIAPEMVWHYGKPVPLMKKNNTINIPEYEEFGVLVAPNKEDLFKATFRHNYDITLEKVFNINYPEKQKNRLISKFYSVKKKDEE